MSRIGFIGLGHMGLPMAINLVNAHHDVTGYDLQPTSCQALAEAGGKVAKNLLELASGKDVLITMLQTGAQVKTVCLGAEGLFTHADKGTLFIDCSSIDVNASRELHKEAIKAGLIPVDAPVSGGVAGAAAATLTFMVGGELDAFNRAQEILKSMGKTFIHTGEAGSGQAAKICNNMLLGITMAGVAETFTLAEQLGLSPKKLHEVVSHASGNCWVMEKYVPVPGILENVPANRNYEPGFTVAMMLKDLCLGQQSAKETAANTPLGALATSRYQQLSDKGMSQLDFSVIYKL